jgi:hypothetical protein
MTSSNSINKRQRTLNSFQSDKNERFRSYAQSRKNDEISKQYTATYEQHILIKDLNMNSFKDEKLICEKSKNLCIDLQQITHKYIEFIIFSIEIIRKIINFCRNQNEAIMNRDVTSMIISFITCFYFEEDNSLEHVVDEVNVD